MNFSDGTAEDGIFYGTSVGEDPTASWNVAFEGDPARRSGALCDPSLKNCPDFPMMGFNTNWIVINTNDFYAGTLLPEVAVIGRQAAECTGTTNITRFKDSSLRLASPAETYHSAGNADPDAATLYLVERENQNLGQVELFQITGTPAAPVLNTANPTTITGPSGWQQPPSPAGQLGTSVTINVVDDRVFSAVVRNGYL